MYSGEELAVTLQSCLAALQHGNREKIAGKFYYSLGIGFTNKKDAESKARVCRAVKFSARVKKNPMGQLWNVWVEGSGYFHQGWKIEKVPIKGRE